VDAIDDWRPRVASYLETRQFAWGAEIARECLSRRYSEMSLADWRRLAGIVISLGFKSRKIEGVQTWCRPL
jgi:hypothetical protein